MAVRATVTLIWWKVVQLHITGQLSLLAGRHTSTLGLRLGRVCAPCQRRFAQQCFCTRYKWCVRVQGIWIGCSWKGAKSSIQGVTHHFYYSRSCIREVTKTLILSTLNATQLYRVQCNTNDGSNTESSILICIAFNIYIYSFFLVLPTFIRRLLSYKSLPRHVWLSKFSLLALTFSLENLEPLSTL